MRTPPRCIREGTSSNGYPSKTTTGRCPHRELLPSISPYRIVTQPRLYSLGASQRRQLKNSARTRLNCAFTRKGTFTQSPGILYNSGVRDVYSKEVFVVRHAEMLYIIHLFLCPCDELIRRSHGQPLADTRHKNVRDAT